MINRHTTRHCTAAIIVIGVIGTGGCQSSARPPRPSPINHVVFFSLTDPSESAALIADCDQRLAAIPGITSYFCGTPLDTGRATVDAQYDVGLYLGFASIDDYAAYVDHPEHTALVEEWGPEFQTLLIRDVLDESK